MTNRTPPQMPKWPAIGTRPCWTWQPKGTCLHDQTGTRRPTLLNAHVETRPCCHVPKDRLGGTQIQLLQPPHEVLLQFGGWASCQTCASSNVTSPSLSASLLRKQRVSGLSPETVNPLLTETNHASAVRCLHNIHQLCAAPLKVICLYDKKGSRRTTHLKKCSHNLGELECPTMVDHMSEQGVSPSLPSSVKMSLERGTYGTHSRARQVPCKWEFRLNKM